MSTVPESVRHALRGTPWRRDLTDAAGLLLIGLVTLAAGIRPIITDLPWTHPGPAAHVPTLVAGCLLMLVKRRRPMLTLAAGVVLVAVDVRLGSSLGVMLVLLDLLYSAALYAKATAVRTLLGVVAVVIAVTATLAWAGSRDVRVGFLYGLQAFALLATPIWWGTSVRRQTEIAELARDRAEDLERIAHLQQAERVRDERERMARELHDAVAGNLSAITIHAEAALARQDGGADRQALTSVRTSSLAALEEMRSMIGLLRTDPGQVAASRLTDAEDVARLSAQHGVELDPPRMHLPAAVDQAAYRILQECLTNATKHGLGTPAVEVLVDGETVRIEVRNAVGPSDRVAPAGGLGLQIMHERATALGGTFEAGPDGGGWLVRATLPIHPEEHT